jgi:hypothetical protein
MDAKLPLGNTVRKIAKPADDKLAARRIVFRIHHAAFTDFQQFHCAM